MPTKSEPRNEYTERLGTQLRMFRKREKITNRDLAAALEITPSNITKYETGVYAIPLEIVVKLHQKFGLNYNWFFNGVGSMKGEAPDKAGQLRDIVQMQVEIEALFNSVKQLQTMMFDVMAENKKMRQQINKVMINHK